MAHLAGMLQKVHSTKVIVKSLNQLSDKYIDELKKLTTKPNYTSTMYETLSEKKWKTSYYKNKMYALILKDGPIILGWALVTLKKIPTLNIYIKYKYRRKGYGTILSKSAIKLLKRKNKKNIEFFKGRTISSSFYNSLSLLNCRRSSTLYWRIADIS